MLDLTQMTLCETSEPRRLSSHDCGATGAAAAPREVSATGSAAAAEEGGTREEEAPEVLPDVPDSAATVFTSLRSLGCECALEIVPHLLNSAGPVEQEPEASEEVIGSHGTGLIITPQKSSHRFDVRHIFRACVLHR